jgi:uncharacterized protein YidB (DUF937 family)
MGWLDSVIGALGQAGAGGGGQPDLMKIVSALMGPDGGGLNGLLAQLQQAGLGDAVASWVSTGQNLPVSAEQLQGALGNDTLSSLARQFGLSGDNLAGPLSQLLPQVVDRLTPNGELPAAGADALGGLGDLGSLLSGLPKR